jgi:hypothetical protein
LAFAKKFQKLRYLGLNNTRVNSFSGLECLWNNDLTIAIDVNKGINSFTTLQWVIAKEFLPQHWTVVINNLLQYKFGVYSDPLK